MGSSSEEELESVSGESQVGGGFGASGESGVALFGESVQGGAERGDGGVLGVGERGVWPRRRWECQLARVMLGTATSRATVAGAMSVDQGKGTAVDVQKKVEGTSVRTLTTAYDHTTTEQDRALFAER